MESVSIIKLLANRNFITVNKILIKKFGLYEAVLLGEFASEYTYWEERNDLEDSYFFSTVENVENNTGINAYHQREAIKRLKEFGILETKKIGLPAKRYIRLNLEKIIEILTSSGLKNEDKLLNNSSTSRLNFEEQDVEKLNSNNNIINNNKIIKINNNKNNIEGLFLEFYKKYPIKKSRTKALQSFTKVIKKVDFDTIMKGLNNYLQEIEEKKTEKKYIKHPSTWLNQGCWEDEYENKNANKGKLLEMLENNE